MAVAPPPIPDAAVAAAAPADNTVASTLDQYYDPMGAMGGKYAPAYIKGYAPSEQAVAAWNAQNRGVSYGDIDALRMPNQWREPQQMTGYGDVYGSGRIPNNLYYGSDAGQVDPLALISMSQGGPYDKDARRNAISQRLMENQQAESAFNARPPKNWWEV